MLALPGHSSWIIGIAFRPDGTSLSPPAAKRTHVGRLACRNRSFAWIQLTLAILRPYCRHTGRYSNEDHDIRRIRRARAVWAWPFRPTEGHDMRLSLNVLGAIAVILAPLGLRADEILNLADPRRPWQFRAGSRGTRSRNSSRARPMSSSSGRPGAALAAPAFPTSPSWPIVTRTRASGLSVSMSGRPTLESRAVPHRNGRQDGLFRRTRRRARKRKRDGRSDGQDVVEGRRGKRNPHRVRGQGRQDRLDRTPHESG